MIHKYHISVCTHAKLLCDKNTSELEKVDTKANKYIIEYINEYNTYNLDISKAFDKV